MEEIKFPLGWRPVGVGRSQEGIEVEVMLLKSSIRRRGGGELMASREVGVRRREGSDSRGSRRGI